MVAVFRLLAGALDDALIAWYVGLIIYWLTWCTTLPLWLVRGERLRELIRLRKPRPSVIALALLMPGMAAVFRLLTGMGYEKPELWVWLLYLSTVLGNGFFEEVLWRGLYLELFRDKIVLQILWPSVFFGLWHYAPGSVSGNSDPLGLMMGAGLFGLLLGVLARKTGGIGWCVLTHVLGGIVMVL